VISLEPLQFSHTDCSWARGYAPSHDNGINTLARRSASELRTDLLSDFGPWSWDFPGAVAQSRCDWRIGVALLIGVGPDAIGAVTH
jgi:hypothetical protein